MKKKTPFLYRVKFTTNGGRRDWATEREYIINRIDKPDDLIGLILYREHLAPHVDVTLWSVEEFQLEEVEREWTLKKNGYELYEKEGAINGDS